MRRQLALVVEVGQLLSHRPIAAGLGLALLSLAGTSNAVSDVAAMAVFMLLLVCLVVLGTEGVR